MSHLRGIKYTHAGRKDREGGRKEGEREGGKERERERTEKERELGGKYKGTCLYIQKESLTGANESLHKDGVAAGSMHLCVRTRRTIDVTTVLLDLWKVCLLPTEEYGSRRCDG